MERILEYLRSDKRSKGTGFGVWEWLGRVEPGTVCRVQRTEAVEVSSLGIEENKSLLLEGYALSWPPRVLTMGGDHQ